MQRLNSAKMDTFSSLYDDIQQPTKYYISSRYLVKWFELGDYAQSMNNQENFLGKESYIQV